MHVSRNIFCKARNTELREPHSTAKLVWREDDFTRPAEHEIAICGSYGRTYIGSCTDLLHPLDRRALPSKFISLVARTHAVKSITWSLRPREEARHQSLISGNSPPNSRRTWLGLNETFEDMYVRGQRKS